ncbi:MAG TPA: alpha-glucan family phosphorylase [Longimicrobiales bacterium]|nr:alpha-glucan family phosphorylase [Longimicrobiales bacterium]
MLHWPTRILKQEDGISNERRQEDRRAAPRVAYFSMEIGLENALPTYSGGLGILAGDTLRAVADLALPMVAVTLVHRKGYFRQKIIDGKQVEEEATWSPESLLQPAKETIQLVLEGKPCTIRAWIYTIDGVSGSVPVFLLDTDVDGNPDEFRGITNQLYGGDRRMRLLQEAVLGLGGVALLEVNGFNISTYHMNEGHSALLGLALVERARLSHGTAEAALTEVRRKCVFTTHTPVPAGHDTFEPQLVRSILGDERFATIESLGVPLADQLNMTHLALAVARYVNGVAMRHREVSMEMFPNYLINAITNGVHATTWTCAAFTELFDRNIPDWRQENFSLRYAVALDTHEIKAAHDVAKRKLVEVVRERSGVTLDPNTFTIGNARRATPYKRADMLFTNVERLREIAKQHGGLQVIYAGKAHPHDFGGKEIIERIHHAAEQLKDSVRIVYVENYEMDIALHIVAGVDLWLNTPQKPQEASGTSGMKAALNGVPSLSVLDGWWIEGHVEGVTGWSIGTHWDEASDTAVESNSLYDKLAGILDLYYQRPDDYARVQASAIALNGSFFTAQRMVMQYASRAYRIAT